jgi:hypothetical protein
MHMHWCSQHQWLAMVTAESQVPIGSDVMPSQLYRVVTTAALLNGIRSIAAANRTTVTTTFLSDADGLLDAMEQYMGKLEELPTSESIADQPGAGLRPQCQTAGKQLGYSSVEVPYDFWLVRNYESPIGNIVADAMYTKLRCAYNSREAFYVALVNVGGIRSGLPAGPLPLDTPARILPFGGEFVLGTIDGATLQQALEVAVSGRGSKGSFLATQGVQFLWDPTRNPGERITRCRVFAYGQSVAAFKNCKDVSEIVLGTNDYLASGGGGFDCLKGFAERMLPLEPCVTYSRLGESIQDILGEHLRLSSPLLPAAQIGIQGRIEKIYKIANRAERAEELRVDGCCTEQCGVGHWLTDAIFRYANPPSNNSVALLPCDLLKRTMKLEIDDEDWTDYKFLRMLALYLKGQGQGAGAEKVFCPADTLEVVTVSLEGRQIMGILEQLLEVDDNQPQLLQLGVRYDPRARSQCRVMQLVRGAGSVNLDESLDLVTTRALLRRINSSFHLREVSIRTAGTDGNGNLLLAIDSALQDERFPTNGPPKSADGASHGFVIDPARPLNPECTLMPATADASIQSRSAILQVDKPGSSDWLLFRIRAMGQIAFNATISAVVTLKRRGHESEVLQKQAELESDFLSAFGQSIFVRNFSQFVQVALDSKRDAWQTEVPLRFELHSPGVGHPCAADGDTIETALRLSSADGAELMAESVVTVEVAARPSCDQTNVEVHPEKATYQSSETIRIRILAIDVDAMPIRFTRLDLRVQWDGATLPFAWSGGSNEYVAEVPAAFMQRGGDHELLVVILAAQEAFGLPQNATYGYSDTVECTVLRRTVSIEERRQVVLISVVAALFGAVLLLLAYLVHRNRGKVRELMISFAKFEGLLALDMCFDILNVCGHALFVRQLQLSRSKAWVNELLLPNGVLFAISCVAATAVVAVKLRFFIGQLQKRNFSTRATQHYKRKKGAQLGDVSISRQWSDHEDVHGLRARFEVNKVERRIIYCQLFAALLQDIPMGTVLPAPALAAVSDRAMRSACRCLASKIR